MLKADIACKQSATVPERKSINVRQLSSLQSLYPIAKNQDRLHQVGLQVMEKRVLFRVCRSGCDPWREGPVYLDRPGVNTLDLASVQIALSVD